MPKCWCGRNHNTLAQRGDNRNSPVKHSVINWKFYELRMIDLGKDPFGEDGKDDKKQEQLPLLN